MVIFSMLFLVALFGHLATHRQKKKWMDKFNKERKDHLNTLLESRNLYEECNRHLKKSGLGEIPKPEILEDEIIKRLYHETYFNFDLYDGVDRMSGRRSQSR